MTPSNEWLKTAVAKLKNADISTARLDCLILLEDATGKDRAWLLAHPELELSEKQIKALEKQVKRRAKHEPLAYIRGKSEFYGREFLVTPGTLEPRPETETMIELLLDLVESKKLKAERIVDVGTGSGCIAVTSKLLFPDAKVYATEINQKALKVAKKNAKNHQADIKFLHGNLLEPLKLPQKTYDRSHFVIVLANLPYVPDKYELNSAAKYEPKVAIFGGEDGLNLYRELFTQLDSQKFKDKSVKHVLTESLPFQHKELSKIAKTAGYKLTKTDDFIQVFELSS